MDGYARSVEELTHRGSPNAPAVVVCGEPRSGTSLMMILLRETGLKIGGEKQLIAPIHRNPFGFWEVKNLPFTGLTQEIVEGKVEDVPYPVGAEVVKLVTVGFLRSDPSLLKKVVFMIREPREVIVSSRFKKNWISDEKAYEAYNSHMHFFLQAAKEKAFKENICLMDYTKLIKKPDRELPWLLHFLGRVEHEEMADLIPRLKKKIKKKLYRSKRERAKRNPEAEQFYNTLLTTMHQQRVHWSQSIE